ncbi:MAG: DNA internalization-related competence protein ComEC/Rec2 [Gemmatimonadetes bacterium]|nr:DNA internalization-related competence protein ComEC/Rec2 [Gemmatimonadota bacterium]MBK6778801.1 DNA internalization-related competence protein ComEC/Rec2 [Gemmatimonadota bacterium]MBK7348888.1 DNA internalization-related competence protein ComEC/Rec2 [Gemmatimonadota bacterium]MBK7714451.1 DNA internalization-related competence protein ComEC/Rec2 [Gemmatimonadota bacterium]MBK7783518.1 DNA internalization-related competence protein ComEC/Rec2 [Gemmatimonadota bacterium]
MRPAYLLLACYGAGLATGLLRFGAPAGVAGLLITVGAWCLWWRPGAAVWPAVALAGVLSAQLARGAEATACARHLQPGALTLRVRVEEPVFEDQRLAAVSLPGAGCTGLVDARWPGEPVRAGTRGRVEGRWLARPDRAGRTGGMLLVRAFTAEAVDQAMGDRFHNWLGEQIRALFGDRAGTVEALLINRRGGMAPELKDRYARAGLVHILSISGFHVGVILAWVLLGVRLLTPRRHLAAAIGVAVAGGYVAFIGWPAPAARAVLLAAIAAQARWRQRALSPLPLLAVTGVVVLLVDPWAALDAGAWLSVAALGGALLATRWSDRRLGRGWGWRLLAGSAGATIATAPISAALFGTVSLAGLGLNFVAIPLAAVVVPGLLLSLAASALVPVLAPPLAAGSGMLLAALDAVAWYGGAVEGLVVIQPAGPVAAVPWLGLAAVAWWCTSDGARRLVALRRAMLAAAIAVWVLAGVEQAGVVRAAGGGLALHFLDVGQGDAALLRTPHGQWILIDAGPRTERSDAGRRVVAPFLARHRAGGLALAVVSHAHADHLGGLPAVLDRFPVRQVLEPAELVADSLYVGLLDQLEAAGVPWQAARDGMRFEIDSVRFSLLHPDPAWQEWQADLNEDSAILLVEYGGFRALFPGDAGLVAEARLAGRVGRVDVLKLGHHGSRSASGDAWLSELAPRVAIISSGAGNRYGHPHPEVLARLARHGIGGWRTDQSGTIRVTTDGRSLTIVAGPTQATFPVGGPP